jgi:hypothetical protein
MYSLNMQMLPLLAHWHAHLLTTIIVRSAFNAHPIALPVSRAINALYASRGTISTMDHVCKTARIASIYQLHLGTKIANLVNHPA